MTAEPITFDAVLGKRGDLRVPEAAAARLAALGTGSTVHVQATPVPARRKFKPTYGVLAHLRKELDIDISQVRSEMADEWHQSGKL